MSTKEVQHWLDNHRAFQDRSRGFRYFTTTLFLFHLLVLLFFWMSRIFS